MAESSGKAFDLGIFLRLMSFARKYKWRFAVATISTILMAVLASLTPIILIKTIDDFVANNDLNQLLNNVLLMLVILLVEVLFQFLFTFYANWVGQHIIRDIRNKIFNHILSFKMSYFDKTSVGRLVTRVVSDIETIASFFTQGVFMIVSDVLKMLVAIVVMLVINWRLALIALIILPILVYATKLFQMAIKTAFQEVRIQVANLNGFVQERVTGMKIV